MSTNKNENNEASDLLSWSAVLTAMLVFGIIVVIILAISSSAPFAVLAASLLVAGSAGAIGVFGGFLFGIPRSLQKEQQKDNGKAPGAANEGYAVNTNLEQISDWLTKIIVGVGLVELRRFPEFIERLSMYFVTSFGVQGISGAAAAMIIIYFAVFSFLIGYLWTRLYLTSQFSRAEELIRKKPEYYEVLSMPICISPCPVAFHKRLELESLTFNYSVRVTSGYGCTWRVLTDSNTVI